MKKREEKEERKWRRGNKKKDGNNDPESINTSLWRVYGAEHNGWKLIDN